MLAREEGARTVAAIDVMSDLGVRERAEIERSVSEARHTAELTIPDDQLRRYVAPPADTCYPLEYSCHLLGEIAGARVVDFGSGSGANTVILARRGARVVGFDISEALLQLARKRLALHGHAERASFCAASAHQLPFADASVDVVFGIAILHHLDIRLVGPEVLRILRTGGRAVFQEPVRESAALRSIRRFLPWRDPDVSPYEQPLRGTDLDALAAGFSKWRMRPFVLPHVRLAERCGMSPAVVRWCYRVDRQILRAVPGLSRYAGIRVIELTK